MQVADLGYSTLRGPKRQDCALQLQPMRSFLFFPAPLGYIPSLMLDVAADYCRKGASAPLRGPTTGEKVAARSSFLRLTNSVARLRHPGLQRLRPGCSCSRRWPGEVV
jgi:hypothetical protein